mgnify:CR=1 FL=1
MEMVIVDLETTSRNPSTAEPITGHFIHRIDGEVVRVLRWKCQPRYWGWEAEQAVGTHGISKEEAMSFPLWINAMRELYAWLPKSESYFVCHAARRMFGKQSTFDHATLAVQFFDVRQHHEFLRRFPARKIISTHSLAKKVFSLPNYGLAPVCRAVGVGFDEDQHHGAEYDAAKCLALLEHFETKIDLKTFALEEYEDNKEEAETEDKPKKARSKKKPTTPGGLYGEPAHVQ